MINASFEINGQEYSIDWPEPELDLFHQINRCIDLEGVQQRQTIFFSRKDFQAIRGWLCGYPWLSFYFMDSPYEVILTLDGYILTLKVKENE